MAHCYIPVTQEFKNANEGAQIGCNALATATTTDGRIVVSLNAVNEFPDLFTDRSWLTLLWLEAEDFPTQEKPF